MSRVGSRSRLERSLSPNLNVMVTPPADELTPLPLLSPKRSYRRKRAGSMLRTHSLRKDEACGAKPIHVIARFADSFGGKWDNFGETGNGMTRVNVQVKSTGIEYPVDSVYDHSRPERSAEAMIVEPIADELERMQDYGVVAMGMPGSGKTHALFNGDDNDLGVAYQMMKSLLHKQQNSLSRTNRRAEAMARLSFEMFELHNDRTVVDLLAPTNKTARVVDDGRGVSVDGATERTVENLDNGITAMFDALQRRSPEECPTCPHTVVKFRIEFETLLAGKERNNVYVMELHHTEKAAFQAMLENVADGQFDSAFKTLGTRLFMAKLLGHGAPKSCYLLACLRGGMSEKPATIATLKSLRSAHELRVENAERNATIFETPRGSDDSPCMSPHVEPFDVPRLGHGSIYHEQEVRFRQLEGKLEAKKKQLIRLQEDIKEKDQEFLAEQERRIKAEERAQDAENATQVQATHAANVQKIQVEALRISQTNELLQTQIRHEQAVRKADAKHAKKQLDKIAEEKLVATESLHELRAKLVLLVGSAGGDLHHSDLLDELRKLAGLPPPEQERFARQDTRESNRASRLQNVRKAHRPSGSPSPSTSRSVRSASRSHSTRSHSRPRTGLRSASTRGHSPPAKMGAAAHLRGISPPTAMRRSASTTVHHRPGGRYVIV